MIVSAGLPQSKGAGERRLDRSRQDALYCEASESFGAALVRLVRAYEADPDKQRDLLQEVHLELWLSLAGFEGRCSLRTWVYRIAHNTGASHVLRCRRASALVDLEAIDTGRLMDDWRNEADRRLTIGALFDLIHRLQPLERQVILLYLEGENAATIGEATGLSATAVATRVHRIKTLFKRQHAERNVNVSGTIE